MKKVILMIGAMAAALSLAACGGAPASSSAPASEPASVSQPASEPASETASEPASEPAADGPEYSGYTIEFDVPEEFAAGDAANSGVDELYTVEDGSTITVLALEDDGSLANEVNGDELVAMLEEGFAQQLGVDVTLENVVFTTGMLDVCPYYRLDYTITLNGVTMDQTAVGINADKAYTITYTDMTGGDWDAAFEYSFTSITPVAK